MNGDENAGFLSRWSRRKTQTRQQAVANEAVMQPVARTAVVPPMPAPAAPGAAEDRDAAVDPAAAARPVAPQPEPMPTLGDVAQLTRDSSYARFVARDVPGDVRNAALKKLFTDPHFNVMDGLDIYIDDYGKPDPLPASWLRQMVQSQALGLFDDEREQDGDDERADGNAAGATAGAADGGLPCNPRPPLPTDTPDDENADLRLQPDDAAGHRRAEPGAGGDAGRQR